MGVVSVKHREGEVFIGSVLSGLGGKDVCISRLDSRQYSAPAAHPRWYALFLHCSTAVPELQRVSSLSYSVTWPGTRHYVTTERHSTVQVSNRRHQSQFQSQATVLHSYESIQSSERSFRSDCIIVHPSALPR